MDCDCKQGVHTFKCVVYTCNHGTCSFERMRCDRKWSIYAFKCMAFACKRGFKSKNALELKTTSDLLILFFTSQAVPAERLHVL